MINFLRVLMGVVVIIVWMTALIFVVSTVFQIVVNQSFTTTTLCPHHPGAHRC